MDENPLALNELVGLCRDSSYKMWGDTPDDLKRYALLEPDVSAHEDVKEIILEAVKGAGLELELISPFVEQQLHWARINRTPPKQPKT